MKPQFSVLHTSARPDAWQQVYREWIHKADHPENVEYILVADPRWGFDMWSVRGWCGRLGKLEMNTGRMCYVDGVNIAARASSGKILVVNADDQFPCEHWDTELLKVLPDPTGESEAVVRVKVGTFHDEHDLLPMPVVSRSRYERLGYLLYPEYESMYADADIFEHAAKDGVLIDARHLLFPHKHGLFETLKSKHPDPAYVYQNRPEAYALGEAVLAKRRTTSFGTSDRVVQIRKVQTLCVCLPGNDFSGDWLMHWISLQAYISGQYAMIPMGSYSNNIYITRQSMAAGILEMDPRPDLVLWIDDDNLVKPEQVALLARDLEGMDADVVSGWYWLQTPDGSAPADRRISAGRFDAKGRLCFMDYQTMMELSSDLARIDWSGFGCVLMKTEALEKAGRIPFCPVVNEAYAWGFAGDDISFCTRAYKAGLKIFMDRRVWVPHLRRRPDQREPDTVLPAEKSADQKGEAA